ncbi:hypothetical protein VCR14J2_390349 [Vibrio coralliirubri]|uniref:helix-turn-helix domain-containing protein n=1 Tax=Vibrio coralliirubri TaxID=1516159 RepID=UPI00062F9337|nr:helix-turn-helix transcriptional regulator [Vibrio coralliirubri]CDU05710.1 hypothetical protein VCR14J2_390349 [Vibrio coralliirubri]
MGFIDELQRISRETSQVCLAKELGVSQSQVCRWINKAQIPSATKVKSISEITGISIEDIINEISERESELST